MTFAIAFSAVFVAGMILILLSFTSFRTKLMEAIPENLKMQLLLVSGYLSPLSVYV